MLCANNISAQVGSKCLLNNVDFYVKPKEVIVIIGPNGAGKSSLLKALCGDIKLTQGSIVLDEQPLHTYTVEDLATRRAVLTQNYELDFPFTVNEVVDMSHFAHQMQYSRQTLKEFSNQAIEALGITHLKDHTFTQLSGGEKQRVQLARVLCQIQPTLKTNKPAYLLIDEPTSSLDIFHQYDVMAQAKNIAQQGAGVVAVIHDLSLAASFADRIYMINNGVIEATGLPEEVLTAERLKHVYNISAQLNNRVPNMLPHLQIRC
ncbi:heme ABC transporter ATP-binding protein [Pseudoalteromonas sp. S558]|uniref:heme ABC transporter ATP-binding protein n=1 Tax=Pseudoalteromonas sp. S558 TaxID=2066515 RepID=UPI00110B034A|nr:heme ABC transporter ATP-binding protein [Pseudoalteromonas sp. S558]TMO02553.1 heme ABC transporter ATP-binding protein [Pseudoalteromonas sp. S558]